MKPGAAKCCPSCGERYGAEDLFCPRDGTPLVSSRSPSFAGAERDPYLGVELAGQIRVKHLIGIGSMGRVYRAFQAGIDRDVAVKILHRELSSNAELVGRFHREAKVASRLVHPNVVQVLMTGAVPPQDGGRIGGELYLVMEHLDGISLLSALAAAGANGESDALPLPRALHIALQVCDAVGEAHAQGIVHRDLKPENVMLVRRGEVDDFVKVLDFGIARLNWGDKSMTTQAGLIFGTAKYISPEGAEGLSVGPPADVYSIATILYQCLAGRTPFESDSHVSLLMHHAHTAPPPLTSIPRASYVPAPLEAVVMKNLAKKAGDRAADARALGREIIAAVRESGLSPEEIVARPSLLHAAPQGVVKMASKARTKAFDLAPELAARIGGVAAPRPTADESAKPREPDATPPAKEPDPAPVLGTPTPIATSAHRAATSSAPGESASRSSPSLKAPAVEDAAPSKSNPSLKAGPQGSGKSSPSHRAPAVEGAERAISEVEAATSPVASAKPESAGRASADPAASSLGPARLPIMPSTIQGTETSVEPDPPAGLPRSPSRLARAAGIAAALAAALMIAFAGGRHVGRADTETKGDAVAATIDEARDGIRKRAWDEPSEPNVKATLTRALARFPDEPRVKELRQEAAERIVTDALGRKYAGDIEGARKLAKLALELSPALAAAQHLLAELTTAGSSPAPAPLDVSDPASKSASKKPTRDAKMPVELRPQKGTTTPAGPTLPPTPPPLPATGTAPPAPTGPWL
jgi:serine/threonine-protein kinase